jgi:hypothetical protein
MNSPVTKVEPTDANSIDHAALMLVIDAFKYSCSELCDHYVKDGGKGPQEGSNEIQLFVSLLVSTMGSIIIDADKDEAVFLAQEIATALIDFTRQAQKFHKERDGVQE